jgi:hypothetical protein
MNGATQKLPVTRGCGGGWCQAFGVCSAILGLVGMTAAFTGCEPKEAKVLLEPSQALGVVLAEEAARAAGPRKQIAIIEPDASWGPVSPAEEAFKNTIAKLGFSTIVAKSANLGDPMGRGPIGLKAPDFTEALEKSVGAGAIVSFAGAPRLDPGDAARIGQNHPPVLVVATAALGNVPGVRAEPLELARLLDAKAIQLAIIDGASDPTTPAPAKTDAQHQLFDQHYHIMRAPD